MHLTFRTQKVMKKACKVAKLLNGYILWCNKNLEVVKVGNFGAVHTWGPIGKIRTARASAISSQIYRL